LIASRGANLTSGFTGAMLEIDGLDKFGALGEFV
jgi:hypothetical protein